MKKLATISIIASMTALSGCATIVNGRYQQVSVQTQPPGARCILTNDKGQWVVNSTPAMLNIHRSMSDLQVTCEKPGYQTAMITAPSGVKPMILGNAVFGGVIGAGIDTVNGAGFHYPNNIFVNLDPGYNSDYYPTAQYHSHSHHKAASKKVAAVKKTAS